MRRRLSIPTSIHQARILAVLLPIAGLTTCLLMSQASAKVHAADEAQTGIVTGVIFFDIDRDDALEQGEGVVNLPVIITDSVGVVRTVVTGADGVFSATVAAGPATLDVQDSAIPCDKTASASNSASNSASATLPTCADIVQHIGTDPSAITVTANAATDAGRVGYRRAAPALSVDMRASAQEVAAPGQRLTYMYVVTNTGERTAFDVTLVDPLPHGVAFVDASHGMAPTDLGVVVWPIGALDAGQEFAMSLTVQVSETTPLVTNVITVSAADVPALSRQQTTVVRAPVAVILSMLSAKFDGRRVTIHWRTSMERNSFGFNVWRSRTGRRADAVNITPEMITAIGVGDYSASDDSGVTGDMYWLQEVQLDGVTVDYGPVRATDAAQAVIQPRSTETASAGGVVVTATLPVMKPQPTPTLVPSSANTPAAPGVVAAQPAVYVIASATPQSVFTDVATPETVVPRVQTAPSRMQSTTSSAPETPTASVPHEVAVEVVTPIVAGAERAVTVSRGAPNAPSTRLSAASDNPSPVSPLPIVLMAAGVLLIVGLTQRRAA